MIFTIIMSFVATSLVIILAKATTIANVSSFASFIAVVSAKGKDKVKVKNNKIKIKINNTISKSILLGCF
jgi:hypothetical protein